MKITSFPLLFGLIVLFTVTTAPCLGQTISTAALNSAGITQATYQKMYAANAAWKSREASGLEASLSIANGKPTVFLEVEKSTSVDEIARRTLALITGLEFILAADGFDRVRVVITETAPGKKYERSVKNFDLTRAQFQGAMTTIAKTTTAEDGVKIARRDRAIRDQIGSQLGIK